MQPNAFTAEEIRLLEELAGDLAFGIVSLRVRVQRTAAERRIEHLAFYDPLTELPNRRLLMDRLHQAMSSCARSRHLGALLFIDLDNFKMLNDTCGHDVGDRLLVEVAHRLSACIRDGDTISRLGGDEFVVMLEALSEIPEEAAAQAKTIAEKILSTLNQPYLISSKVRHSTPSIGAALFGGNESSVDEPLKQADIAMYQAKTAGRNTLRFFDPDMQAALAARAELESDLRRGIENQQFALYYQAQVHGQSGVIGAEALLRWHHPSRGMVFPAQFIPLAEETGLILPIGQWVLEEACIRLAAWSKDPRYQDLHLAVNVSARQFRQPDFVNHVHHALQSAGAPATRLKIELTESLVLDDINDSIIKMHVLREIGVNLSMDDFGTGYSSLSYLTRLPLNQLKIDQSFVQNLPDSTSDSIVVQAIITLAQSLKLDVIAEGVETEAQRQFLDQHGCPICQGYLFSRPVALADFEVLLQDLMRQKELNLFETSDNSG
jgi:diguanylate cyclase (GGDEF)-like protein